MINRKQRYRLIISTLFSVFLLVLLTCYHQSPISNFIPETEQISNDDNSIQDIRTEFKSSNSSANAENKVRLKTIFIWNSPERIESIAGFGTGHQPFIDHGCPISNCFIQVNESSEFWSRATANNSEVLKSFDAVVLNIYNLTFLPDYERPASQRFVWLSQESPGNQGGLGNIDEHPAKFEHLFNWTMTYKRNSDIQFLYGRIHPILNR